MTGESVSMSGSGVPAISLLSAVNSLLGFGLESAQIGG